MPTPIGRRRAYAISHPLDVLRLGLETNRILLGTLSTVHRALFNIIYIMRSVVMKVFWMQPAKVRSEELSVCLGSYLRGIHGDVNVDASGKEVCRSGRLANVRAATRVKPEQAPKELTWRSSRPYNGEDHWRTALENRSGRTNPPGYWAQHAQKHQNATREISAVRL